MLGNVKSKAYREIRTLLGNFKTDNKEKKIVIACDGEINLNENIKDAFCGICDGGNKRALALFEKQKLNVITCGMGSKNSVSVTSIGENRIILAFLRGFYCVNGNFFEPQEEKIDLNGNFSSFAVMAAYTAKKVLCIST